MTEVSLWGAAKVSGQINLVLAVAPFFNAKLVAMSAATQPLISVRTKGSSLGDANDAERAEPRKCFET